MDIKKSDKVKNEKKSHIVIPVKKEIDAKELVNLVASFICSHEEVPIQNATIGQESNNYIVQVKKLITNKRGKVLQVETTTVQLNIMPKSCIVDFSSSKEEAGEKFKKEAGLTLAGGVACVTFFPPALIALPAVGVALAVDGFSAKNKIKKSHQLQDNVFALIYDYLGYDPDTRTERFDIENISAKGNETAGAVVQTCECGYVFKQKMLFCPECGKKVAETVERTCECGNILSEGIKFCPQCGKSVS